MSRKVFAISLLLIVSLCSFLIEERKSVYIVFIGDSITEGGALADRNTEASPVHACAYLRQQGGIGKVEFSNQGVSGFTTVDFLPSTGTAFNNITKAAHSIAMDKQGTLVFSIMLGTNDSAIEGPNGAPVSPESYRANLKTIADRLLSDYSGSKMVFHYPIWYSPNTYNSSRYLAEGLKRLQSYFPELDALVASYARSHPGRVFIGDKQAYQYFENKVTDFKHESGKQGTFYLHPNNKGAAALGRFWGTAIRKAIL